MVATFAILGFLLFVSGVVRAIQAHSNGRENYATACGAFALFGLGLVIAPMFMKRQPVVPEAVAATPVVSEFEVKQAAKTAARQMGEAAVRAALLEPSSARCRRRVNDGRRRRLKNPQFCARPQGRRR